MNTQMIKSIKETSCMEETAKYAYEMASKAQTGQVYALIGDLGVGKTVFTRTGDRGAGEFSDFHYFADL